MVLFIDRVRLNASAKSGGAPFLKTSNDYYGKLHEKHLPGLRWNAQKKCPNLTRHGPCDVSLCPDGCENFHMELEMERRTLKNRSRESK